MSDRQPYGYGLLGSGRTRISQVVPGDPPGECSVLVPIAGDQLERRPVFHLRGPVVIPDGRVTDAERLVNLAIEQGVLARVTLDGGAVATFRPTACWPAGQPMFTSG